MSNYKPPGNPNTKYKRGTSDFRLIFSLVVLSCYLEASQKLWDHIIRFLGVSLVQLKGITGRP